MSGDFWSKTYVLSRVSHYDLVSLGLFVDQKPGVNVVTDAFKVLIVFRVLGVDLTANGGTTVDPIKLGEVNVPLQGDLGDSRRAVYLLASPRRASKSRRKPDVWRLGFHRIHAGWESCDNADPRSAPRSAADQTHTCCRAKTHWAEGHRHDRADSRNHTVAQIVVT
jgi:hypothetical protein